MKATFVRHPVTHQGHLDLSKTSTVRIYSGPVASPVVLTLYIQQLGTQAVEVMVNGAAIPDNVFNATGSRTFRIEKANTVDLKLAGPLAPNPATIIQYQISVLV